MYTCGRQSFGRLGRGPALSPNTPAPVELPPPPQPGVRWRVLAVAAGGRHTLAAARLVAAEAGEPPPPPVVPLGGSPGRLAGVRALSFASEAGSEEGAKPGAQRDE